MSRTISSSMTSLAITNPLVLYRSLLQTKQIAPDPAQYRLALHLQKLYTNLLDYSPETRYGARLKAVRKSVETPSDDGEGPVVAVRGHPLRRNPLFAHLFQEKERRDTLALTRVLTNHEEAMRLDSPQGLLLYGEVGTGKSMMVDLLADCLPNKKKRRWHYNTFMLEVLARLEQRRIEGGNDSEHSLIWLAKDLIDKSPILFLDEFQLPDRTAAKILSNLLTAFFQLGGVLIASSNRMPDELSKASGMDFTAPSRGGVMRKWLGYGNERAPSLFPSNNEYATFVEVLKARCEIWDIRGDRDWRRRDEDDGGEAEVGETLREDMIEDVISNERRSSGLPDCSAEAVVVQAEKQYTKLPKKYVTIGDNEAWNEAVIGALPPDIQNPIPWCTDTILVYGRKVPVPRHFEGVTLWTFEELCESTLGPADYITLASTFHTLILDGIPVLHTSQKNEARRLITFLDAVYEARCKLVVRAETGPDDLFFPDARAAENYVDGGSYHSENEGGDAVYPETLSEIYQDQISPFRPNVSVYEENSRPGYNADEDSDFGPLLVNGDETRRQVDFGATGSFTGEDEKFAYKRASSRLWEMCGARWHARSEPNWWRPLPLEFRKWERSKAPSIKYQITTTAAGDVKLGPSNEVDLPAGLRNKKSDESEKMTKSPFREERDPPAPIGGWHAWGITTWGKKAGAWGQGPEGLAERKKGM